MEYINIVKQYIRAEHTGDWNLHLASIKKMLNLFAATGHVHYAKSARFYLQQMCSLDKTHPEVYHVFVEKGFHTVRQSDRFWSGIWSDMVIEQDMMRSLKTSGGLTRGRGMTESSRSQWVSTTHEFANVHDMMTQITNTQTTSSEQHVDISPSQVSRDTVDCKKLYDWLTQHNPFTQTDNRLKSLSTGVIGVGLTCHKAEEIGNGIQERLDNVPLSEAKVRHKESVV